MKAFKDNTIKGIFCAIGGDDTIRLLPYIDYEVIKNNPKKIDQLLKHFQLCVLMNDK